MTTAPSSPAFSTICWHGCRMACMTIRTPVFISAEHHTGSIGTVTTSGSNTGKMKTCPSMQQCRQYVEILFLAIFDPCFQKSELTKMSFEKGHPIPKACGGGGGGVLATFQSHTHQPLIDRLEGSLRTQAKITICCLGPSLMHRCTLLLNLCQDSLEILK